MAMIPKFAVLTFGVLIIRDSVELPTHGKDYFFNEAEGRMRLCAEFCDLPTDYSYTCKERCNEYIPKNRTTPAPDVSKGLTQGLDKDTGETQVSNINYVPFAVTVVCLLVLLITVLVVVKCFGEALKSFLSRIKERLCDHLTEALPEQGTQELSEQTVSLQENPTVSTNMSIGQAPQATDNLL